MPVLLQCLDHVFHMQLLHDSQKKIMLIFWIVLLNRIKEKENMKDEWVVISVQLEHCKENDVILQLGSDCITPWPWLTASCTCRSAASPCDYSSSSLNFILTVNFSFHSKQIEKLKQNKKQWTEGTLDDEPYRGRKGMRAQEVKKQCKISKERFLSSLPELLFAVRLSWIKAIYQQAQVNLILTFPFFFSFFPELLILEH